MRLAALLGKDARLLLRNRALLVALLAYPFLLGLVLGAAFQEPPSTLTLAVLDEESPAASLDVAGRKVTTDDLVAEATPFAVVREVRTESAALGLVRRGEADAALLIPRGFLGDLGALGSNATLRLVVDESDPVRAGVARNAVEGAVDAFVQRIVREKIADVEALLNLTVSGGSTTILLQRVDILGIIEARARLEEVHAQLDSRSAEAAKVQEVLRFLAFTQGVLGNSEVYLTTTALPLHVQDEGLAGPDPTRLSAVALPGALVLGVFWTGALSAALLASRERETGVRRRLAAAPRLAGLSVLSKTLVALAAALLPGLVLVALGVGLLGADPGGLPLVALVLVVASLAAAALGALAAALARGSNGAALLAVLALLPMLLLGGLFYPVAYMPAPAQVLARALPVTQATEALRGALLRGSPAVELALPLAVLVLFAGLAGAAAAWLQRRAS